MDRDRKDLLYAVALGAAGLVSLMAAIVIAILDASASLDWQPRIAGLSVLLLVIAGLAITAYAGRRMEALKDRIERLDELKTRR